MLLPLILGFVLGASAILFALQNTEIVELSFLGFGFESSLALLVLLSLATGVVIALLLALPGAIRDGLKIRGLAKENDRLRKELAEARTPVVAPVAPQPVDMRTY